MRSPGDHRRSAPRLTGEESVGRRSHSANIQQIALDCDTGPGQSIKFAGDINAGVNLISQSETGIYRITYKSVGRRLKSLVLAATSRWQLIWNWTIALSMKSEFLHFFSASNEMTNAVLTVNRGSQHWLPPAINFWARKMVKTEL